MKKILSTLTLILLMSLSFAEGDQVRNTYFCQDELGAIPIRQGGRVKPLYVHANELIKFLSGKTSYQNLSAVQVYCLLSLQGMDLANNIALEARVDHVDAQKLLELPEGQKTILLKNLVEEIPTLQKEIRKQKVQDSRIKALQALLNQAALYREITSGQNWLLPAMTNERVDWIPVNAFLREDKVLEAKTKSKTPFLFVITEEVKKYEELKGSKHLLEYRFSKAKLPIVSLVLTLIALASLTLFKKFTFCLSFSVLTLLVQISLITIRVLISGRAPITNMYETVMFSGFGALFLSLIVGHLKKEKIYVYMGLMYNACTLMMMNFATGMLSESISPLVPVLRDNFWLSTHVTTIIMSYGALALSWILANTVLIKKRFSGLNKTDENYYSDHIYTTLKWGTIMLGAGIILGGVWADYSWGRFWGWDPKETWSLIAFIIYMAILHGRYTSWIPTKRFIPLVAAAFMSIMMAWFGVNYILASGLHSYGFSEGGALFLGSFFLVQTGLIIVTGIGKPKSFSQREVTN
ncbi:MAG: cytochrome c biogenesis protein CcsA [Bacteriovoracaceae bacterium]|nr:cytochrome c biogenesis protein CcsA [Bacteriovoracaceae bacterium]